MLSFLHRKPSLKPSSYSASPVIPSPQPPTPPPSDIIHVAAKGKCRKRSRNVFTDDWRFPDLTDDYDPLLHNIDGGPVLQKLRHPAPPLDKTDPSFNFLFDVALHGERLRRLIDLSHLNVALQTRIYNLIKSTGPSSTTAGSGYQSKIMNVLSTQAIHPPLQSRTSVTGQRKYPS